jgi:3-oxoacyl-[acyl-carrier-protein] synthase II
MPSVVITGLGVVSPLGHSVAELTRRCRAGERAVSGPDGGVLIDSLPLDAVPADARARSRRLDRICRLFLAASFLAVDDAALAIAAQDAERVGLSFGTGLGCLLSDAEFYEKVVEQGVAAASPRVFAYTVSSAAAGEVSIALGIHGPNVTSHMGLAAGLGAIGYGFDLIQMGKADVVLAGGADANGAALVQALRDMRLLKAADAARPFRDATPGVWPSEGAAVVVLERADRAHGRGARARARLEGYAAGFEPTLTGRAPAWDGITTTLRRALAASGRAPREIGTVLASAHGTPLDACERAALVELLGNAAHDEIVAPKQALGETFGASGALSVALAVGLLTEAPAASSDAVLISSLCYSGSIAALVLSRGTDHPPNPDLPPQGGKGPIKMRR